MLDLKSTSRNNGRNFIFFHCVTGKSWPPSPRNFHNGLSCISWNPIPPPPLRTYGPLRRKLIKFLKTSFFDYSYFLAFVSYFFAFPSLLSKEFPKSAKFHLERKCCTGNKFSNYLSKLLAYSLRLSYHIKSILFHKISWYLFS